MHYVYILASSSEKLYIGVTSDLKKRLKSHNSGANEYTRKFKPWQLVYYEAYVSGDDAKDRENKLKYRGRAKVFLKQRLKRSLIEVRKVLDNRL